MINPNLSINKDFKEQVKICMKTKFATTTQQHISKKLLKPNTRVLTLVMFYETRKNNSKKLFKVLSFVIYNIISNYVCIDCLGSENFFKVIYVLVLVGGLKHFNESYDKILGFGIPDLLMNLLSCHGFLKKNDYVVIIKILIGCLNTILIKD